MAMELRKAYRLTKEQDEELKRNCEKLGITESEFIRLLITQQPKDYPEIRRMLRNLNTEINHIGNNINQIVKNNNSSLYREEDKERLISYMKQLRDMVKGPVSSLGNN